MSFAHKFAPLIAVLVVAALAAGVTFAVTSEVFQSGAGYEITTTGTSNLDISTAPTTGGAIFIRTRESASAGMFIDTSNNVGIGTTAPGAKLHASGSFRVSGPTANGMIDTTITEEPTFTGTGLLLKASSSKPFIVAKTGTSDTTGGFAVYNSSNTEVFSVRGNGDSYASIMYDRDNTAYYVNPAGTSITNDMRANIFYDQGNTGYYVDPNSTSNVYVLYRVYGYNGPEYDINNGGYYLDPNGTSRVNYEVSDNLYVYGTIRGGSYGFGGAYRIEYYEGGSSCWIPNPATGACSCPGGFTPLGNDGTLAVCYR